MDLDLHKIIEYEKINSLCLRPLMGVMAGFDLILRDDLALICTPEYPTTDGNHAFLLRTSDQRADALIDEVIGYFKTRDLPPAVFLSPACIPTDLPQRLLRHGFDKQETDESWMVYEHLQAARVPKTDPRIVVRLVEGSEAKLFASVMASGYEMPPEWVPMLAKGLAQSLHVPTFRNYLALIDEQPLATLTLYRYNEYAIVGGASVVPQYRGSSLIFNLTVNVLKQARNEGVDTAILQTILGPTFERFLRICGFKLAFRRTGYIMQ